MRSILKENEGERRRFQATFARIGKKRNFKGHAEDTILLQNIIDLVDNRVVADHVWFAFSKVFDDARIREGDVISFDARIRRYAKGYVNSALKLTEKRYDFKLSHPTKVEIVSRRP